MKLNLSKTLNKVGEYILTFLYKNAAFAVMAVATLVALFAKFKVVDYPTHDVVGYIFKWMDKIKEVGFKNFHSVNADYSPLYLFFISLLTLIPKGEIIEVSNYTFSSNWMTALKASYFVVDIVNAIAVYLIIKKISGSKNRAAAGYLVMTTLPVQFINSAIWGQADCIYTCFLLFSIYFALEDKSCLCFLMFGFAMANKLQALFLAPFLMYLILRRKVKFSAVLFVPIAILISFLPAYICGASFTAPFMFFGRQLNGYSNLTLGCPNFWHLFSFRSSSLDIVNRGAVYFGLLLIGVLFAIVWLRLVKNTDENLMSIAVFLSGVTIFFLPHMHERYFYLLDVLVVAYALSKGKKYHLIVLMQLASGIAYYHYISGNYFIQVMGEDSVNIAAFMVVFVLGSLFYDVLRADRLTLDQVLLEIKEPE